MARQDPMHGTHTTGGTGGYGQQQSQGRGQMGQQGSQGHGHGTGQPYGQQYERGTGTQQYGRSGSRMDQQGGMSQQGRIGQQGGMGPQGSGTGQQVGGVGQQGQGMGQFEGQLPSEMRVALEAFETAAKTCDWCADRCIDEGPEMAECIRLCRDVADLGSLNAKLIARDSVYGPEVAEIFARTAEDCANECMRHPQAHCQECASVLNRAVDSTYQLLDSLQAGGGGMRTQQF